MLIDRHAIAAKLADYLHHELPLAELVDWAENALLDGEFAQPGAEVAAEVVARLGVADVRAFGLTWEDCESLLARLGYAARIELTSA